MTREEAELAAATFEFPPFTARAIEFAGVWLLEVTNSTGLTWPIDSTESWLAYYAEYQRTHGATSGECGSTS